MGGSGTLLPGVGILAAAVACAPTPTPQQAASQERASTVRVIQGAEDAKGCQFVKSITAREEPPVFRWETGTPAITILQRGAAALGADTVEVTSSERSYQAGPTRARSITTLTGNAYRCGTPPAETAGETVAYDLGVHGNATVLVVIGSDGMWADAELEGDRVVAIFDPPYGDRIPLANCQLGKDRKATCSTEHDDRLVIDASQRAPVSAKVRLPPAPESKP